MASNRAHLVSAFALGAALLATGVGIVPASAHAPPEAGRPEDQSGRSASERERAYAGLSLGDAVRQALIEGDLDFAFSTMSALGAASGDRSGAAYFAGLRAFSRGEFDAARTSLAAADQDDMMTAALVTWSEVARGNKGAAEASWEAYGKGSRAAFYDAYRGLLAEAHGQTDLALTHYKKAQDAGELLFAKDIARRYATLLARTGKRKDAVDLIEDVLGKSNELDREESAFVASLATIQPVSKPPSATAATDRDAVAPKAAVSSLLSNFAAGGMLVRALQAGRPPEDDKAPRAPAPDPDSVFLSDALTLRSAILVDPDNMEARLTLARLLTGLDEDEAAKATLEAISTGPRISDALLDLSATYESLELPSRGLEILNRIPTEDRAHPWWDQMSDLLFAKADYQGALQAARRGRELATGKGDWAEGWADLSLANGLFAVGDEAQAIEKIRAVISRTKPDSIMRGAAGIMLAHMSSTRDEGIAVARAGLDAMGADGRFKAGLGGLLAEKPQTRAEGVQLLRDALAEFPRSPVVMNQLGYILVEQDIDLIEGFELLQKAHDLRPKSGAIADSLGRAYYKLGQFDEAIRLIELAVRLRGDALDPEIFDNLGDAYWHSGRTEDAKAQWRKALAIGGPYDRKAGLPDKIARGLTTPAPQRRDAPQSVEPGSI